MTRKTSKTTSDSIEETRKSHCRYLRALNNPLRRKILNALKEECLTFEELLSKTSLKSNILKWHLDVLNHDFCIEKEIKQGKTYYRLTQEGKVISYLE
jgi:DNA-binding transcriptional ArsR family regulator